MKDDHDRPGTGKPRRLAEGATELLLDSIIPYQLNRLTYRMNKLLDRDLKKHGLNITTWRLMAVLDFNTSVSVSELASYTMVEQSTLSRLLQRLEASGLLESHPDAHDGRARAITLTELGRRKFEEVRALTLTHVRQIVQGLDRQDRTALMGFVSQMQRNVDVFADLTPAVEVRTEG